MGVGAAVIFPTTLALITNMFTDPARVQSHRIVGRDGWCGVAAGPITGGWLLEHFAWGCHLLGQRADRRGGHHRWLAVGTDFAGPSHSAGGCGRANPVRPRRTALVYTVIEAPNWGWTSAYTGIGFALATAVLIAFAVWERRRIHPMLDVSVFANRRFSGGSLAVTAGFFYFCSASSSSSPSTSNSSSPTAPSRPVSGCCRWRRPSRWAATLVSQRREDRYHRHRQRGPGGCSQRGWRGRPP